MNWFRRLMGWPEQHHLDMTGSAPRSYIDGMSFNGDLPPAPSIEDEVKEPKIDDELANDLFDCSPQAVEAVDVVMSDGQPGTIYLYGHDRSPLAAYTLCSVCDVYYSDKNDFSFNHIEEHELLDRVGYSNKKNYVSTGRAIKINGEYKEIFRDLKMPEENNTLQFPREEYYLDRFGRMHTHHANKGTSLHYSYSYTYDKEENLFHNPGHGSLRKYIEYKNLINKPAFKRRQEDICDLRCPRDCECWEDRHPRVMAAYETPTGPKGNTDLDECDCLSCGVETITGKEAQTKTLVETRTHDNPLCRPAYEFFKKEMIRTSVWNVVDVPEPGTNWVRIARMKFGEEVSNEFLVTLKGELVPFSLRDPHDGEYRPLHRYYAPRNGYTEHTVTTTGEFEAIIKVDDNQCVVDISVKGESVDEISLPSNHVFFTHVQIKVPASEVL